MLDLMAAIYDVYSTSGHVVAYFSVLSYFAVTSPSSLPLQAVSALTYRKNPCYNCLGVGNTVLGRVFIV